ncbi:cupin domain-containing protein [Halomarina pelagica]|uniref:cupin domain-containing protein n=1 Tax=Halomarina pelagica TaxID=2961599 RepID=UPI0020C4CE48|nr:cupin domain-containing protein [Halomarina sp. BND7]
MEIVEWDDPHRAETAYEGIERRVLAHDGAQMLVHYTVEEGAEFPEHEHEEAHQAVFVIDGAIELFGDREALLETGDSFVVGPGVRHGIRGVAPETRQVCAFTPPVNAYAERRP